MKRFCYLFLTLITVTISLAISDLTSTPVQGQGEVQVPQEAQACIDSDDHFAEGGSESIASITVDETDYYLIYTYEAASGSREYPSALLISSAQPSTCQKEYWNTGGFGRPYSDFVPFEVAVHFKQIELGIQLERLGREEFIDAYSSIELFPEEVEAIEQLGVSLEQN